VTADEEMERMGWKQAYDQVESPLLDELLREREEVQLEWIRRREREKEETRRLTFPSRSTT